MTALSPGAGVEGSSTGRTGEGLIAVVPDRGYRGLVGLADPGPKGFPRPILVVPFAEAFTRHWETDAHFTGYLVEPYDPEDPFYRINKTGTVLQELRAAGGDLLLRYAGVDWDTGKGPAHLPWSEASWQGFQDALASATDRSPSLRTLLASAAVAYTTAKGYRWVFRLDPPPPVEEGEVRVQGIVDCFRAAGLLVDELADWTRLFRLPLVTRRDA